MPAPRHPHLSLLLSKPPLPTPSTTNRPPCPGWEYVDRETAPLTESEQLAQVQANSWFYCFPR
ncbi:hypothetical protein BDV98DRAFT_575254 [Pterulicium gracile]|uniref:Uncharacterized protein n=1 Tax=Pterulicium gracile TaxID=1884261 RepID=A0A5C3Q633_9AGAR|nr:hypothetical protein BDV98DRAFT_575254 [Pterula gracilis]